MLNIKTRSDDPHVVDDFEVYGGLDELLKASWYTYQNDSCEANVSITDEFESTEGYALRFDYKNNRSGWVLYTGFCAVSLASWNTVWYTST